MWMMNPRKSGIVIQSAPNVNVVEWGREHQNADDFNMTAVNWPDLLHIENLEIDDREPLRVEQEAFLGAVNDKSLKPEVTAKDGLAAMECAEGILDSIKKHKWT